MGQAVVGAYELLLNKADRTKFTDLSRLFVYYNARLLDNIPEEDVGSYTRDGTKKLFLARNSFGEDWCMDGYFLVPFDYAENDFMDSWVFDIELS